MEGGGQQSNASVYVSVSGCSCGFPQMNFKTSPNSSSSSEDPSAPALCIVLRGLCG